MEGHSTVTKRVNTAMFYAWMEIQTLFFAVVTVIVTLILLTFCILAILGFIFALFLILYMYA